MEAKSMHSRYRWLFDILRARSKTLITFQKKEEKFILIFLEQTVFVQGAAATPQVLVKAMTKVGQTKNVKGVTVCHMHTEGDAPYTDPSLQGKYLKIN